MNDILAVRGQAIKLGFQGENNAKRIIFDLSEFIEDYGPGTATVFYQQQRDPAPYPVITEQEGNKLYWTVKDTETHIKGYGLAQLVYTVGDTVAKTCLFETHILRSLSEPTDPPEGYESWVNNLLEKASELESKIIVATEIVETVQEEIEEARELLDEIKEGITDIEEDVIRAETAATTATTAAENAATSATNAEASATRATNAEYNARISAATAESDAESAAASALSASGSATAAGTAANAAATSAQTATDAAERAEAAAESIKANHIRLYSNGTIIYNPERTRAITFAELHELVSDTSKMVTIDNQGTQIFYLGTIFDDSVEFFETYIFEGKATAARMIMNDEGQLKWDEIDLASKESVDTLAGTVDEQSAKIEAVEDRVDAVETDLDRTERSLEYLWKKSKGVIYDTEKVTATAYEASVPSGAMEYAELQMLGGQSVVWNQMFPADDSINLPSIAFADLTGSYIGTNFMLKGSTTQVVEKEPIGNTLKITNGHKYLIKMPNQFTNESIGWELYPQVFSIATAIRYDKEAVLTATASNNTKLYLRRGNSAEAQSIDIEGTFLFIDLTQMFGAGNEPADTNDPRIRLIEQYAEEHPEYNEGEILSAMVDKVVSKGKNLFDINSEKFIDNAYIDTVNKNIVGGSGRKIVYVPCEPNTKYTASKTALTTNERFSIAYSSTIPTIGVSLGAVTEGATAQTIGNKMSVSITTDSNARYIVVWAYWANLAEALNTLQIERGEVGNYVPYHTPIDKPLPTALTQLPNYGIGISREVCNYVDYVNKKYVQMVGVVDLGSLVWTTWSSLSYKALLPLQTKSYSTNAKPPILAKNYENFSRADIYNGTKSGVSANVNEAFSSLKNPVGAFYYELATPIETDISDIIPDEDWNILQVEANGSIEFHNENKIAVPSTVEYMVNVSEVV